jgi:DNA-directed RNA polymerase subunit omega
MARITIEDCMEHVPNRFHLVRMASIRAKQLKKGALPLLTSEDNKQIVMSLREIAAGLVKPGDADSVADTADTADTPEATLSADASVKAEAVPTEEARVEETKVEETKVEEAKVEEASVEEVAPAVEPDEPTPATEG